MKKISVFALALCTNAAVFAQDNQPQLRTPMETKTRIGLRAGVNFADLTFKNLPSGSEITEAQHKTSFNGSLLVNIPISSTFRFQPEVGFSSQGGKLQGPSGPGSTNMGEQDLHYINVPLNFQLMTSKGFFIQTGPQLGYLLDAKIKEVGSSAELENEEEFDKIDFSWTGGIGYLSRIGLGVDLRYNIGIANIIEDNTSGVGTVKNSVGQFSLIYHFGAYK